MRSHCQIFKFGLQVLKICINTIITVNMINKSIRLISPEKKGRSVMLSNWPMVPLAVAGASTGYHPFVVDKSNI